MFGNLDWAVFLCSALQVSMYIDNSEIDLLTFITMLFN